MTTSYDYDAPLSEAGDPTEKLFAIRTVISKVLSLIGGGVWGCGTQHWAPLPVPGKWGHRGTWQSKRHLPACPGGS